MPSATNQAVSSFSRFACSFPSNSRPIRQKRWLTATWSKSRRCVISWGARRPKNGQCHCLSLLGVRRAAEARRISAPALWPGRVKHPCSTR